MLVSDFNRLPSQEADALVRPCADVDRWVEALVAGRPYADLDELMATAVEQAATWSAAEVEAALAGHPRIGEQPAPDGAGAAMSRQEQAGVSDELAEALLVGNRRYEQTFDRIFLVRAAGRSGQEILTQLHERLGNDPETEREVVKGQLAEIAVLRLRGVFA